MGHILRAAGLTLLVAACKPPTSTSETKTLDNFAGGKTTINACAGSFQVSKAAVIEASDVHQGDVRQALSAIPSAMQTAFFDDLNGRIIVAKELPSCKEPGATSCWAPASDTAAAIYVREEANSQGTTQNIRHALVRSFGYLTAQLMLKLDNGADGTRLVDNPALVEFKEDLALTLINDIAVSPKYTLSSIKVDLPPSLLKEATSARDRRAAWEAFVATGKADAFTDAVLAETFDSYYCSNGSKTKMAADFGSTYAAMKDYADTLEELFSGQLDAKFRGGAPSASAGMALWFPGQGILRGAANIGRGWGNWRASGRGLFNFRRASAGGGFIFNHGGFAQPWF